MKQYLPVIGLEIHVELKTTSKMFCECKANQFDAEPNSHVCPVCLGLPGALPVPNKKAIEWTIKIGQALNCTINKHTKFDRKHYTYPDLPKGYQISQYDEPIAVKGKLKIFNKEYLMSNTTNSQSPISNNPSTSLRASQLPITKDFRIHRVHLEEDTGKLIHKGSDTLIDFNRSGTPLIEIVTEADFTSSDDVKMFLEELHTIIRYLDVSDADMEKGTMRMEPNISVREITNDKSTNPQIHKFELPNYKVEVKNINSFNFVKRAIDYEVKRHIELLEQGKTPIQETRGWDSNHNKTYSQRTKEEAHDYRYFPEPDIPPFEFSGEYIESIKNTLVELPHQKMHRYIEEFKLRPMDAYTLTRDLNTSEYFEEVMNLSLRTPQSGVKQSITKIASSLPNRRVPRNDMGFGQAIANLIINKKLSTELSVEEFVKDATELLKPKETDTKLLDEITQKIITANLKSVTDYKAGKQNAIMFLVGQVMKEMKGKADANTVISKLKDLLK